jgi:hypothetical protein
MTKIGSGMAEMQAKTCGRRFIARESCLAYVLYMSADRNGQAEMLARGFSLFLRYAWTDFVHFFVFLNPSMHF